MPTVHVGHSPDPDDAFMFCALTFGKLETAPETYEHHLLDIETLNQKAARGEYEVTAFSIHAYAFLTGKYLLLPHGASMGDGYGPMIVARPGDYDGSDPRVWLEGKRIAIPGVQTSAFLALNLFAADQTGGEGEAGAAARPRFTHHVTPFDEIMKEVSAGRFDAGLIIHEGQLTYHEKASGGLKKVVDLGEWWKGRTGLPLPLGGNGIRKDLGAERIARVSKHLYQSIKWGLEHRQEALKYALKYARDMGIEKADRFVGMYVNDYTLDYGDAGRAAISRFLHAGRRIGMLPHAVEPEWATD
ncbi:MAG: ABC transporter substrate-binding protein [Planctomycetota bacterium]|nr:ABC transporter substrate-binding protein [Planctomycetota bacterium]